MKKVASIVVGLVVLGTASASYAETNMSIVKTCVVMMRKQLGPVGASSSQATQFLDQCVRDLGREVATQR